MCPVLTESKELNLKRGHNSAMVQLTLVLEKRILDTCRMRKRSVFLNFQVLKTALYQKESNVLLIATVALLMLLQPSTES